MLAVPPDGGPFRLHWRVPTLDADLVDHTALVDATTGALLGVKPTNPHECPPEGCADCSPGFGDAPEAASVPARARPENWELIPCNLRYVEANPCSVQNETSCNGPCTHEAVWEATTGIPQIEVYHGMIADSRCQHCEWEEPGNPACEPVCPFTGGKYMRVGLAEVGAPFPFPTYDLYGEPREKGVTCTFTPHPLYRRFAGDAMFYTQQTMEVLWQKFERCGFDGACGIPARIVVDGQGCHDAAYFLHSGYAIFAPINGVGICHPQEDGCDPPGDPRSMSAAIDIVAHEWGHAVSKWSPADFPGMCPENGWEEHPDECEMSEGFADVVGHMVERFNQPTPDAMTSFEMAARVLFRVLDTESDPSTIDWDLLPYLARNAAWDLFPDRCEEAQTTVIDAFRAVGYPQQLITPCVFCPPYSECPPCCPPDHCCGGVEE